jgi:hypothetical protein
VTEHVFCKIARKDFLVDLQSIFEEAVRLWHSRQSPHIIYRGSAATLELRRSLAIAFAKLDGDRAEQAENEAVQQNNPPTQQMERYPDRCLLGLAPAKRCFTVVLRTEGGIEDWESLGGRFDSPPAVTSWLPVSE